MSGYLFALALCVLVVGLLYYLLRTRRIREKYAGIWIVLVTADVVQVKLDSCGPVAQKHIEHVLSQQPIDQPCVDEVESISEGGGTFYIYDVVPAP